MNSYINRAIVIVLDSVGIGEMPDSADYGDVGCNTLAHAAEAVGGLDVPTSRTWASETSPRLPGCRRLPRRMPALARWQNSRRGKDTTVGHWEMMGVVTDRPFPTYPDGFPPDVIDSFEKAIGRKVLGNKAASGTEIIGELGEGARADRQADLYTSADSVF